MFKDLYVNIEADELLLMLEKKRDAAKIEYDNNRPSEWWVLKGAVAFPYLCTKDGANSTVSPFV